MNERAGGSEGDAPKIYAIELREETNGAAVAIIRLPGIGERDGPAIDVWTNRFASIGAARGVMRIMSGRADQWASWARMAKILGTEFLTGVIEGVIAEAGGNAASPGSGGGRTEHPGASRIDARTVHLTLESGDPSRIVATRGGRRFMELTFLDRSEAWRAWDWIRWQSHQFQAWYALANAMGSRALQTTIIRSILIDEAEARASGRSADGPRPLRHWRPTGSVGRPETGGEDADPDGAA